MRYGARVYRVDFDKTKSHKTHDRVTVHYYDPSGSVSLSNHVAYSSLSLTIVIQSHELHADYVVFAVPYTSMRLIEVNPPFDPKKSNAITQTRYVNVTKILLQFKKRWWEKWLVDNEMVPPEDEGSRVN